MEWGTSLWTAQHGGGGQDKGLESQGCGTQAMRAVREDFLEEEATN